MCIVISKQTGERGTASSFNTHALCEVLGGWDDGEHLEESCSDLNVQLVDGTIMGMNEAFAIKRLITDNYNTSFREPKDEEEKERGYYL